MQKQIVIVGAGYAGMMAAMRLSHTVRRLPDYKIVLVNTKPHFVERIRLHEVLAGRLPQRYLIDTLLQGTGVEFVEGTVASIAAEQQAIAIATVDGLVWLGYTHLVYTPGSATNRDAVPGVREFAVTLDADFAAKAAPQLANIAEEQGSCVVVGGGFTGIEAATELAERYPGLQVKMVLRGTFAEEFPSVAGEHMRGYFGERGIEIIEHAAVRDVTASGVKTAHPEYGELNADMVIWTGGFAVSPLAKESEIATDGTGRVIVDEMMRSVSHPEVFAAGDAVTFAQFTGMPEFRESCQMAMPMGSHVADNIAAQITGKPMKPANFGYTLWCLSLGSTHGMAQMVDAYDQPAGPVFTGWAGSVIKRLILRYTLLSIKLERRFPIYSWRGGITPAEAGHSPDAVREGVA